MADEHIGGGFMACGSAVLINSAPMRRQSTCDWQDFNLSLLLHCSVGLSRHVAQPVSPDTHRSPTGVCDAWIANKLAIPAAYLRRMREQAPWLYDQNVNG
ncbi:MAG TPA: hypothetical protein VHZ03_22785 [Trebonia sp.]|jgi:hypothetical protein|nr:hypothetical protein [Trebonia sp.]